MNRPHSLTRIAAVPFALALLTTLPSSPLVAQGGGGTPLAQARARHVTDLETLESKFLDLANAMDADQYSWRPMEGVRSVSEVFMLIVAENWVIPASWGAEPPEGMTVGSSMFSTLAEVTDKATVVSDLRRSFAYYKQAVSGLSDVDMASEIQFFGRERSVNEALFLMAGDMHEHLGQAIAYARVNHVVPPWTARRQANR